MLLVVALSNLSCIGKNLISESGRLMTVDLIQSIVRQCVLY